MPHPWPQNLHPSETPVGARSITPAPTGSAHLRAAPTCAQTPRRPSSKRPSGHDPVGMDLKTWVTTRGGIVHREDARERGYPPSLIRAAIRGGEVERIRAKWISTAAAPQDLRTSAAASARLTCISLARRREWWIPEKAPAGAHLHVGTNAHRHAGDAVLHWSEPLVDVGPRALVASIEDALAHVARCFDFEDAMTIWESAMRRESLDVASLRAVRWRDRASRELAHAVRGMSDSGLFRPSFALCRPRPGCRARCRTPVARVHRDPIHLRADPARLGIRRTHGRCGHRARPASTSGVARAVTRVDTSAAGCTFGGHIRKMWPPNFTKAAETARST